jgi:hypothetical protein
MKAIGWMIRLKEKESTCIQMGQCTPDNGSTINSMDTDRKSGSMDQSIREISRTD